ncbi:hypothetical protein EJB05_17433 [Eragrostis curvula]|uniref:Uncharacterized protein n=1 Tax=Eragrostis curvula TaxID=38414 RepID=A0A5J9VJ14_9POAL|nr:hypothetical protein EJB05_17433 [Eragrostis curvula]
MQEASSSPIPALSNGYQPLQSIYLGFLVIWAASGFSWAFTSWRNRHFSDELGTPELLVLILFPSDMRITFSGSWALALVPLIKALQMALSFFFWYSCVHLQTCSLWMSFGAYVTRILFQTASFVSFMLISHGYCIMCERLSIQERRITAVLGCLLYLSLIGYKAAVPYFTLAGSNVQPETGLSSDQLLRILLHHIPAHVAKSDSPTGAAQLRRRGRHTLAPWHIEHEVHNVQVRALPLLFFVRRFQGTMQVAAVAFIMVYMRADDTPDNYWFRVLVREWVQFCIFMYIGWNFRIPEASLHLPVVPLMKSAWEITMPPIYSVEMDAADFKGLVSDQWHVGVRTGSGCSAQPLLVLVQNPSPMVRVSKFQLDKDSQV